MNDDPSRPRRARLLAALTLLVTFAAGGVVGAAVENARDRMHGPPRGAGREAHFLAAERQLAERLELSPAQRDSIRSIVRHDRALADSIFREMRPRVRARFDSTLSAIEGVLTPAQREEFRKIRDEHHPRHRGHHPGGPGQGHPIPPPHGP